MNTTTPDLRTIEPLKLKPEIGKVESTKTENPEKSKKQKKPKTLQEKLKEVERLNKHHAKILSDGRSAAAKIKAEIELEALRAHAKQTGFKSPV